jgi:hypothetical protein
MSNEQTILSRRAVLGASVAVLGCATAVAVPALAEVNADAELLEIGKRWEAAAAQVDAHDIHLMEASQRYSALMPKDPPEALFFRSSDDALALPRTRSRYSGPGSRWWYRENIEQYRATFPEPSAQARADEIVAAYDQWWAEIDRANEVSGMKAAEAKEEQLFKIESELRTAIMRTPARTMEGALLKARASVWCSGGVRELEEELATTSCYDASLAQSVVLDVLKMMEARS